MDSTLTANRYQEKTAHSLGWAYQLHYMKRSRFKMCITFTSRFIVNIKLYIMKFEDCKVVFFSLVSRVDSAIEKKHSQIYVSLPR